MCGFLGSRGGGEEKERWEINAKAQKGKGEKGEGGKVAREAAKSAKGGA